MQYIYQGADALCRTYTRALTLENLCQFGSDLLAIWLDGWWGDSKKSVLRRPGSLYSITSLLIAYEYYSSSIIEYANY